MYQSRNLGTQRPSSRIWGWKLGRPWGWESPLKEHPIVTLGRAHPHLRGEESNSGRALQDEVAEAILGLPVQVPISLGTLSSHLASLTSLQHWSVYSSRNASLSLWHHSIRLFIHSGNSYEPDTSMRSGYIMNKEKWPSHSINFFWLYSIFLTAPLSSSLGWLLFTYPLKPSVLYGTVLVPLSFLPYTSPCMIPGCIYHLTPCPCWPLPFLSSYCP